MKNILTCILLVGHLIISGQNKDSIVNTQKKEIERLKEIIDAKEEEDLLARVILNVKKVKLNNDTFEIDKVELSIKNGWMTRSRVILKNGLICETKKSGAVQLALLNKFGHEIYLYYDTISVCNLSYLITYLDELDKINYLPEDKLIILKPIEDKKEEKLFIKTDINSLIDFRVYTDMLALFNKESNGLVQSEISSKITINSQPHNRSWSLLNYIEPTFKFSKFDNQFKNQLVVDTVSKFKVDRLKLNQLSYIELGFRMNLMKASVYQHSFDLINIGMDFKYSDILLLTSNNVKTLNTFGAFVDTRGQFLKYKNFGFEYGVQGYFQKIQDSNIENYNLWDPYLIVECSIFYHPNSNPLNMVFVRFKNIQTGLADQFYSLLQFGYKSKLSFKK